MKTFALVIGIALFAIGCGGDDPVTDQCQDTTELTIENFAGLDGCSWILTSTSFDGRLEPINLLDFVPTPTEGQVIKAKYQVKNDLASICQVGEIVEIECIVD